MQLRCPQECTVRHVSWACVHDHVVVFFSDNHLSGEACAFITVTTQLILPGTLSHATLWYLKGTARQLHDVAGGHVDAMRDDVCTAVLSCLGLPNNGQEDMRMTSPKLAALAKGPGRDPVPQAAQLMAAGRQMAGTVLLLERLSSSVRACSRLEVQLPSLYRHLTGRQHFRTQHARSLQFCDMWKLNEYWHHGNEAAHCS